MLAPDVGASFIAERRTTLARPTVILITHRSASIALADRVMQVTALVAAGLVVQGHRRREIAFLEIAAPLHQKRILGFRAICLPLADGSEVVVAGVRSADAFLEAANAAWRTMIPALLEALGAELETLAEVVERLEQPRRYPSACLVQPFWAQAADLATQLPNIAVQGISPPEDQRRLADIRAFHDVPDRARDTAIEGFREAELGAMQAFFDTIEAQPLTPEQRLAVVTDEDATLVLAGAGSGRQDERHRLVGQLEISCPIEDCALNGRMNCLREVVGQRLFHAIQRVGDRCGDVLDDTAHQAFRHPNLVTSLQEMPGVNAPETIMLIPANRHRKLHLLLRDLPRIKTGLRRQHIVKRR